MTDLGLVILSILTAALALMASVVTQALTEIAWHELEAYCKRRRREKLFDRIHDRADEVLAASQVLQSLGTAAVATLAVWLLQRSGIATPWSVGLAAGLMALGIVLVTVWLPREIARWWGPPFLVRTWPFWTAWYHVLQPLRLITRPLQVIARRLHGRKDDLSEEEALEDEILSIVTEGQHDGLLESGVREMIAGVIELDDTDVAEIMTPRSQMDAVPVDMPWDDLLRFVVDVARTRIPVYKDSLDDIVGILYAKDLLAVLSDQSAENRPTLEQIMRPAWRIPRSIRLDELLRKFLQTRSHLAIVVDEFMHVAGLVTIEDVLEEIVGEIVDEYDREDVGEIKRVSEHVAIANARAHLEDVNEQMGTDLPEDEEYDTLGGFLLAQWGRIPEPDESLTWNDLKITVLETSRRRIERVRLEVHPRSNVAKAT